MKVINWLRSTRGIEVCVVTHYLPGVSAASRAHPATVVGTNMAQGAVWVTRGAWVEMLINGRIQFYPQLFLRWFTHFNCDQLLCLLAFQHSRSQLPNRGEEARGTGGASAARGMKNDPLPLELAPMPSPELILPFRPPFPLFVFPRKFF